MEQRADTTAEQCAQEIAALYRLQGGASSLVPRGTRSTQHGAGASEDENRPRLSGRTRRGRGTDRSERGPAITNGELRS